MPPLNLQAIVDVVMDASDRATMPGCKTTDQHKAKVVEVLKRDHAKSAQLERALGR